MNYENIKDYVEDLIDSLMDESGLTRNECEEDALINCVYFYDHDEMSREDLLSAAEYLGYELDMTVIDETKVKHQKQRAYRHAQKVSR